MITVLLLSNDINEIKNVSKICEKHKFLFLFVESKDKFINLLKEEKIVVCIVNSTLLQDPLNVIEELRNMGCNSSFIYIGEKSFENCRRLLKSGFYDYLLFHYKLNELEDSLLEAVENVFAYEKIKSLSDELERSNRELLKKTNELECEKNTLKDYIELLKKIQDFVKRVSVVRDIDTIVDISMNYLRDIFNDRVILFSLIDNKKISIKKGYNIDLDKIKERTFYLKDITWIDTILDKKQKVVIKQCKDKCTDDEHLFSHLSNGFAVYPLVSRNRVFGTITFSLNHNDNNKLFKNEPIIYFIAEYAAIAMDNILLFNDLIKTIENLKNTENELLEKKQIETIAKFAVSINHEINNPLCSISLNVELLKKMFYDENNEMLCKIFNTLEKNIDKITEITTKIHSLKRVTTKEYLPGIDMIDLNED